MPAVKIPRTSSEPTYLNFIYHQQGKLFNLEETGEAASVTCCGKDLMLQQFVSS